MTIKEFIRENRITFSFEYTTHNPNMSGTMPAGSRHYACRFGYEDAPYALSCYFSQGPGILREPTAEDVLDCLASDAASYENAVDRPVDDLDIFATWAGEYGFEMDKETARTYRAVRDGARKLREFLTNVLGDPQTYETLLWEVGRL